MEKDWKNIENWLIENKAAVLKFWLKIKIAIDIILYVNYIIKKFNYKIFYTT